MAFKKKTWLDRIAEYPTRRRLKKSNGTDEIVTVSREEGTISQEGDAFSAANMNDLEKRIDDEFNSLNLKLDKLSSHVGMIIQTTTLDTEAKVKAIYGGISWIKIEGKMLLGQSSNYAINKTGGSATNTLSVANLPSHAHGLNNHTHSYNHTHGTNVTGGHVHTVQWRQTINEDGTHNRWYMCPVPDKTSAQGIGLAGEHTHITTSQSTTTTGTASGNTTSTGNGKAINNMPPYKVVYIWERTA